MADTIQNATSTVLALCAVTAVVVMFRSNSTTPLIPQSGPPVAVDHWDSLVSAGHRIGPVNARLVLVEFGDFECPACGGYEQSTLRPFLDAHSTEAALVFRHWPLTYHRFSYPAARASECAADQGRFASYHDILYAKQDSLGLKPFAEMARDAGVEDIAQFERCADGSGTVPRIERDIAEVKRRGGTGTPTIFVNGYRWFGMPTISQLDSILGASKAVEEL